MRPLWRILMFVLILVGCFGPTFVVQQYAGPQRPNDSIAILRVNGSETVRLLFLDEADVAAPLVSDGRLHVEVLPARHTIEVGDAARPSERFPAIGFQAEANKVYRVLFVRGEPRVYEVDRSSDKSGRDVTIENVPQRGMWRELPHVPASSTAMNEGAPPLRTPVDAGAGTGTGAGALEGRDE